MKLLPLLARFPWREGNRFELLVDGASYFPRMLAAIASAQRSIDLEMYLVSSGKVFAQFLQALQAAAARGVRIRILLDAFGSADLVAADRQVLRAAGIEVLLFNRLRWRKGVSNLLRNHRKLLLIDQQLAFVGGTGITDDFWGPQTAWHEVVLGIRGPVVNDWLQLFERSWFGIRKSALHFTRLQTIAMANGRQRGRVCASQGPRAHHVTQSLYQHIAHCRRRVWLVTPYFLPNLKLRQHLLAAAKRGVDVRLLTAGVRTDHPAIRHASHRYYARLLRNGIRIFEYQPRFIHAKIALCDDWVSLGSTNFDRWNLLWNLDANQEIDDDEFATQVSALIQADFVDSAELHYTTWQQRPLYLRFMEWATGLLEQWLSKLRKL